MAEKRRRRRRVAGILWLVLVFALIGAFIWLTWQPYVRIAEVEVVNGRPAFAQAAEQELSGTYLGIVPKNSYFFIPRHAIRAAIIEADASYQAVGIDTDGFTKLILDLHDRAPVARWCGLARTAEVAEYCYFFDAEGYIFAADPAGELGIRMGTTTAITPLNGFSVYDELAGRGEEPLRSTLAHANALPATFELARRIGDFGSPVDTVTFRGDEADFVLISGTRITYVLGEEEQSITDLVSALPNLDLSTGLVEYVDLRFPGKVYLKRVGE